MKKLLVVVLLISVFTVMGCSKGTVDEGKDSSKTITLDFMTNVEENVLNAYKEIAKKYEAENPNVKIKVTSQGKDFESLIKAKMAANDLPDLWSTHGWSVARYSSFLEKLNDQPWAGKIEETLLPSITNDNGEFFVLPFDIDKSGVVINETVLEEVGMKSEDLITWDDFMSAFEKIKAIGKTPVGMGGKDPRIMAHFLDVMSTQVYIASEANDHSAEFLDGSFDWSNWSEVSQLLVDLKEKGYLNLDVATASADSINEQFAQNNIGFVFSTNTMITAITELNPDVKVGFIPLPIVQPDGRQVLIGGERDAVGVWKDSKNKETALDFLNFMAKEENVALVAQTQGMAPALKNVTVDFGNLTTYFDRVKDVEIQPFFDRVYLPNGMWSTLQTVGGQLVVSGSSAIEDTAKLMKEDFTRLKNASAQ